MEDQAQPIQPQMPVQPAPEPVQVPAEPKKSLPKWPLIIVGVILLATLLTGSFVLYKNMSANQKPASKTVQIITPTPTPDPTAGWNTYVGSEITFKYPSEWKLDESDKNNLTLEITQMLPPDGGGSPQPMKTTIAIKIKAIPTVYTLDQWFQDQYLVNGDQASFNMIKQFNQNTLLDGQKALAVTTPGAAGYLTEGILSIKTGLGFNIFIIGQDYGNNEQTYKQILSTFKFTQ